MDYGHTKNRSKKEFFKELGNFKNPLLHFIVNPEANYASCYAQLYELGNPEYRPVFGGVAIREKYFGGFSTNDAQEKEYKRFIQAQEKYISKYKRWYEQWKQTKEQ